MRINNLNLFTDSIFSMRKGKKKVKYVKKTVRRKDASNDLFLT